MSEPLQPDLPQHSDPTEQTGTRRLAAIMFTDIKDFSRRMQKDEEATMRMLRIHNTMMTQTVTKYGGKVIKTVGDAFLVSFGSVVAATQCAIEVQQDFHRYNDQMKIEDDKITVRIGVHLGDVIETDKDIFGDGVNIASRIQSIAEVGGLNISESVYQQVKNKLNIRVINLGVPQLKGISEPIKLYQVIIIPTDKARGKIATNLYVARTILRRKKTKRGIAIGAGSMAVIAAVLWVFVFAPAPPANSIAVLPFTVVGDQSNQYLADAFTQDIHTLLSDVRKFKVLSSGLAFKYRKTTGGSLIVVGDEKKEKTEKDVVDELKVRNLLVGTIEFKGEDVEIRARLTDPVGETDVWNKTIKQTWAERELALHEIYREIFYILQPESEISREAWDDYNQAMMFDRRQRKEDNKLAINYLESALKKEPNFQEALIKLATLQIINLEQNYDRDKRWLIDAEKNLEKALALDTTNAEIYGVLGRLHLAKGDREIAMKYLERSIQMNPELTRSYIILGGEYLQNLDDPEEAIKHFLKAHELEPTNFNTSMNLAIAYAITKNYPEGIKAFRNAAAINPRHEYPWMNMGVFYELTEEYDSADYAYRHALELNPSQGRAAYLYGLFLLNRNKPGRADSVLSAAREHNPKDYDLLYTLGIARDKRGSKEEAMKVWREGLTYAESEAGTDEKAASPRLYAGLFCARLAMEEKAFAYGNRAIEINPDNNEMVLGMSRIYAVLGRKDKMIEHFSRARKMNPEYDSKFVLQEIDFERFHDDDELLIAARQ